MNMKRGMLFARIALLSLAVLVMSCDSDNDEKDDTIKVTRIDVDGVNDDILELEVADEYNLSLSLFPDTAQDKDEYDYIFSSTNEEVFKVSDQGVITAIGVGEAALRIDPVNNNDLWTVITVKVKSKLFLIESLQVDSKYQDFYIGMNKTIDLTEIITINPEYATNQELLYSSSDLNVATVTRRGVITTLGLGDTNITVKTDDGSALEATITIHVRNTSYEDLSREGWGVTTSHQYFEDATVVGSPESLIDDPDAYGTKEGEPTCLCLVKPGKSLGGITVGASEEVYFVIDMQKEEEFSAFRLRHRLLNTSANLRLAEASVYGSNDGENFTSIAAGIAVNVEESEVTVDLPTTVHYRYFKLVYTKWGASGSTVQISDFNIVKLVYEEL
ncbi:discoidin domain-containing protein [Aestuariibaculum marinum]|uniref:Discoidin domain-containing protein n=1 Tax=Aestuariibaculum marinum TaxID=2683592 RepID=A0A8J6PZH6_9FLAO|nr:discoidin domain-containing protein [Aestuariibaculum marinum]MBD0825398.1 discoidin domain-containing protein [Aestuariibaculum marinum]